MKLKYIFFVNLLSPYISFAMEQSNKLSHTIHIKTLYTPLYFGDKERPFYELQRCNHLFSNTTYVAHFSYNNFEVKGKVVNISSQDLTCIGMGDAVYCPNLTQSKYGVIGIWTGPFYLHPIARTPNEFHTDIFKIGTILIEQYQSYNRSHSLSPTDIISRPSFEKNQENDDIVVQKKEKLKKHNHFIKCFIK